MEANTLVVHISCARGLYLKNHNTIDAVASITLQGKGSTKSRVITEVVQCETDCKWDENCEFKLNEKSSHLAVAVNHKTKLGGNDLIGKVEIPLDQAKRVGGHTWFALKKRKDDEKYRGEVQLQFAFHYEKPSLSISNSELNHIGKDSVLDKMKRKFDKFGKHKQAEDTMSMASGFSAFSVKSSRSHRFMNKLNKTFGGGKSSTLPVNKSFDQEHDAFDSTSLGGNYLAPPGNVPRPSSYGSGLNFAENNRGSMNSLTLQTPSGAVMSTSNVSTAAPMSPSVSTAESFHRANSIRSVASSGFGSSKLASNQKLDHGITGNGDILAQLDSLRLELQVKDSRMKDMQQYIDNLTSRVMERCPDLLATPAGPQKSQRRYF